MVLNKLTNKNLGKTKTIHLSTNTSRKSQKGDGNTMAEIITTEQVRTCPLCDSADLVKDYKREEIYCNNCGLIISSAVTYVGLEKIHCPVPHSAPAEARNGVHLTWTHKNEKAKTNHKITNYKHRLTNKQLMKYGKR